MSDHSGVLVIDGSSEYRTFVSALLTSRGYEVVQAADASAAVEALGRRNFAVILLDLKMPHDGVALIDYIGDAMPHLLRRTIALIPWQHRPIWGVLSKPLGPDDVTRSVAACAAQ